jgi:hypothetical protein
MGLDRITSIVPRSTSPATASEPRAIAHKATSKKGFFIGIFPSTG